MNQHSKMMLLITTQNPVIYFIEGTKDVYFGRVYTGAFLPFDGNSKSEFGLYYIANLDKFFYRVKSRIDQMTRLLCASDESDLLPLLMPAIEKVLSTKTSITFNSPGEEQVVKKIKKIKAPVKPFDLSTLDRFIVLKGGDGNKEGAVSQSNTFRNTASKLEFSTLNFTFRSSVK